MKQMNFKDLKKVLSKLEKLREQADKIRKFVEIKIECSMSEACEETNFDNEFLQNMLAIEGSIEGAIENINNV